MSKYELVIFDLDGTLLDTTEGVLSAVNYTIQKHHLPAISQKELKTFIGPPIQNSFKIHYGFSDAKLQELAETFREQYKTKDLLKAEPYENIYDVFDYLSHNHIKTAVATYKRQDYAVGILRHFGFDRYTGILYGADNFNKLTKKDIIKKCILDSGVSDYSRVLMIGDSDNDATGAGKLGIDFLGVTYGFGFKSEEDVNAHFPVGVVSSPSEIINFFERTENHENESC